MTASKPQQDPNRYLKHSVQDLLSLKGRTIVITGGARGLGLAFALAVVEVGGNVAVLDAADKPHEHFYEIQKKFDSKLKFYKSVQPEELGMKSSTAAASLSTLEIGRM